MHRPSDRLTSKDLQFSFARLGVAVSALCVFLAVAGSGSVPLSWLPLVVILFVIILFNDWSLYRIACADVAMRNGRFEHALRHYTAAIKARPEESDRYLYRGIAWGAAGEYARAVEDATRAIELGDVRSAMYGFRGRIYGAMNAWESAEQDYLAALEQTPIEIGVLYYLAELHYRRGRFGEAFETLDRYLDAYPLDAAGLCLRGWFLATCSDERLRDGKLALETTNLAASLARDYVFPDLDLELSFAASCAELGNICEALQHAKLALQSEQGDEAKIEQYIATLQRGEPLRQS